MRIARFLPDSSEFPSVTPVIRQASLKRPFFMVSQLFTLPDLSAITRNLAPEHAIRCLHEQTVFEHMEQHFSI
ncbi:MAG: hypothetical protein K6T63_11475 [Alicyclobacillus herbarius]|nr:hypothetical protein [Alicyclobacillus herbarius]